MDRDTPERKLDRLKSLLAAFGSDPCQWPEEEQRHMGALFSLGAEADALREEARLLDEILLTAKPVEAPSPDLAARIVMAATEQDQLPPYEPVEAAPVTPAAIPGFGARLKARIEALWDGLTPGRALGPAAGVFAMLVMVALIGNPGMMSGVLDSPAASPSVDVAFDPMDDPLDDMIIEISVLSDDPLVFDMDL